MTEFQILVIGGGTVMFLGWLSWETRTRISDRKEIWHKMHEIETDVTKLGSVGFLTYERVDELLDKKLDQKLTPIQSTLNAIAHHENAIPDRRKKDK